jgi:hypothetical protein
MNPATNDLLAQLDQVTNGLTFGSENDFPFKPVVLETAKDRPLTAETLLEAIGLIKPQSLDDLLNYINKSKRHEQEHTEPQTENQSQSIELVSQEYQEFIETLQLNLKDVQIYCVSRKPLDDETRTTGEDTDVFYLVIGKTQAGDWIGRSPEIDIDESATYLTEVYPTPDTAPSDATSELVNHLRSTTHNLVVPKASFSGSENSMIHRFLWNATDTRDWIVDNLLRTTGFVRVYRFEPFENQDPKLAALDQVLRSHLTDLRTYIIGCQSSFWIYTLGQTRDGDWAGVATQAVWT